MVENRPLLTWLAHIVLLLGILVVAFPIWVTLVASTHTTSSIATGAMGLWPGDRLVENYGAALASGSSTVSGSTPVWFMMWNSLVMALGITIGKIVISMLSAFAIVYFRFPFRMGFFWLIFITLMLPVEVRILPTYEVVANLGMLDSYAGPDRPADRLGDGDLPVPPVLPDRAGRIDRGGPDRRCRTDAVLQGLPVAAQPHQHRGAVRHPVPSTGGTSTSGRS